MPIDTDAPNSTPVKRVARKPLVGLLIFFIVVALVVTFGARTMFNGHSSTSAISTAGSASTETTAPADKPGH